MPWGPAEPLPADSPVQAIVLRPAEGDAVAIDLGLPASGTVPPEPGIDGGLWLQSQGCGSWHWKRRAGSPTRSRPTGWG